MVAEDKFASGYMAGLKRQKRLKPFLNLVYNNQAKVILQPGHIRPSKNRGISNKMKSLNRDKNLSKSNLDS